MTEQPGPAAYPPDPASANSDRAGGYDDVRNPLSGRAISVRQPWAWALIHGGKDVENRGRRDPWFGAIGERVWVHAAKTIEFYDFGEVRRLSGSHPPEDIAAGALVGGVVVRDVHHADTCFDRLLTYCSPWAQPGQWHIVVSDPIALPEPIPWRGALGLFSLEDCRVGH